MVGRAKMEGNHYWLKIGGKELGFRTWTECIRFMESAEVHASLKSGAILVLQSGSRSNLRQAVRVAS